MSDFVVHSVPGSPFGRAVLATLVEKGAGFRLAAMGPGVARGPEHLSRHPFGRVPVLQHEDFTLYETQAILRYLDRVLPDPALSPKDPKLAARMDQIMNISDWYLFQGVINVLGFQRIVGPRLLGLVADERAIEACLPQAGLVLDELSRLLGGKRHLASEEATLADLLVASQLDFIAGTPEWAPLTAERRDLVAWLERMRARPSFRATTWERVAEMAKAA